MKERALSMLMAVAMVISLLSLPALAAPENQEDATKDVEIIEEIPADEETVVPSTDSDQVEELLEPTATPEATPTLTIQNDDTEDREDDVSEDADVSDGGIIYGTDAVWNYDNGVLTISGTGELCAGEWWEYVEKITSIIVGEGITDILGATFQSLSNLKSVTLPSTLRTIDEYAFAYDYELGEIIIPEGVTTIGASAFYECSSLTSVSIPTTVVEVGWRAFGETPWLSSCQKTSEFVVVGGGVLIKYTGIGGDVVIPDGVTSISEGVFSRNSSITSVTIPASVITIGENAFFSCENMTEVTLLNPDVTIGADAFFDTPWLDSLKDENGFLVINGVLIEFEYVGEDDIVIPDGVYRIENGVFSGNVNITSVTMPEGLEEIGEFAFAWCTELKAVNIPDSVTEIGGYAFEGCTALQSATLPAGLTSIAYGLFELCSSLTQVDIPVTVQSIGDYAFSDCASLQGVSLPAGLSAIQYAVFDGCTSLTQVSIPDSVTEIQAEAFKGSGLTSISLPESVTSIQYAAFADCAGLTSVSVPESVTRIGQAAFNSPNLAEIAVHNPDCQIDTLDGVSWVECYGFALGTPLKTTVYGDAGSSAEAYAETYNYNFNVLTLGDADGDGKVTETDMLALFQYLLAPADESTGDSENTEETEGDQTVQISQVAMDVTGDDVIDLKDVTRMYQLVTGQITSF